MSNQIDVLDSVREILLAIVPAMCGIAMPLLLQAIERIDAKYQSIGLVELFKKECIYKVSTRVLILSCFYFIYITHCRRVVTHPPLRRLYLFTAVAKAKFRI